MSRTFEWQIRAPLPHVLELLQYYWWEQGHSVEILDGPQDDRAWMQWRNIELDAWPDSASVSDHLLLSATDDAGWTTVWPVTRVWDEVLWRHLSWEAKAPILAGEYNSVTGHRRWAWFDRGERQAERDDFGNGQVFGYALVPERRPNGATSLDDAFAAFERSFPAPLWLKGCKQLIVRGQATS